MKDHVSCMPLRRGMPGSAAAMAALLALLLSACGDGQEEPAAAAAAAAPAPTVTVTPAARENVTRSAEFLGRVEAIDKVDLRARVTGLPGEAAVQGGRRR